MLGMNGIIACELILGGVWMGLIFTSFAATDLIADRSSKLENEMKADGFKTVTKQTHHSTHVSQSVGGARGSTG